MIGSKKTNNGSGSPPEAANKVDKNKALKTIAIALLALAGALVAVHILNCEFGWWTTIPPI